MTTSPGRRLEELDRSECLRLLSTQGVGRLAVACEGAAPLVVPVNFVLDGEHVVFRSEAGTKLRLTQRTLVSFQVDSFDWGHRTGWSVLACGPAHLATHWESDHMCLEPWPDGDKPHWVRIRIEEITGRVIRLSEEPLMPGRGYL